jgi:hypothetical protein
MYQSKHTRQKSLKKYMKFWRSKLARLNSVFDSYIKENFKVVDYQVKTPSLRKHNLTWRPYGNYKRMKSMKAHSRCLAKIRVYVIEARPAVEKTDGTRLNFDTDSYDILIDNCCSHTLTNDIKDYIEPPVKSEVRVRGYNGSTNSTMHNFILPNTYYSSSVETRLLSPQHWAQVRDKGRDTYCVTYHDAIIMRWNKDKYQITATLDNRKHRNVGVMRSVAGIQSYPTSCTAYDQEYETLAYPATISTSDEAGETESHAHDEEQMREITDQEASQVPILHDEDNHEEEEYSIFAHDSQEYMHWHYRLNHPTHTVMTKMGQQGMLPRRITKILATMDKKHTKAPMRNDCCGAKATRRPWIGKSGKSNQSHIRKAATPGEVVSVDQLESSIPGFIGQMTGRLTNKRALASTIFVDHAFDLGYVYHQTSMSSEETLKSKLAFEKFAASHVVYVKH